MKSDSDPTVLRGATSGDSNGNAVARSFARTVDDELPATLIESASECFVVADESGRIVFANPAVESVFGHAPDALVGEGVSRLIPERFRAAHAEGFETYLRTGERSMDWDYVELPGLHRDGHEIPLLVSFREFDCGSDRYVAATVHEITERVEQREDLESERAFVDSVFDALPDLVYAFDETGQFLRWNDRVTEVTGYSDEEITSLGPMAFLPESDHDRIAALIDRAIEDRRVETVESRLVTKDGREIPYEFTGAPLVEDGEVIGLTGVGRDVSERKRREETLERLNELNTVIRSAVLALVEGTTRDEIASVVCDHLVAEDVYRGAVVGRVTADGNDVRLDASAGIDSSAAADALLAATETAPEGAAAAAVDSGSVVTVGLAESDASITESGASTPREDVSDEGKLAAVPLLADGRAFGVLGVFVDESRAVTDSEREVLRELGEGIGAAMRAALTRRLLYADAVTEIELRITDRDAIFAALSADAECRLELERTLSFGDEDLFYFTVSGASPETVVDCAADVPGITDAEHCCGSDEEPVLEFSADAGTVQEVLIAHGARATDGVADRGEIRVVAELPPDADVRAAVGAVQDAYPETELIARRDVERSLQTAPEFRQAAVADLTDKQRAALEAAFALGYFEWPARTSDARKVADTLGIAPQTFHQHLRVALQKVLAALLDGDAGDGAPA